MDGCDHREPEHHRQKYDYPRNRSLD
eukprot:SAG31_NODE_22722_length_519_cov_1.092857_1_plen_25_part_01